MNAARSSWERLVGLVRDELGHDWHVAGWVQTRGRLADPRDGPESSGEPPG